MKNEVPRIFRTTSPNRLGDIREMSRPRHHARVVSIQAADPHSRSNSQRTGSTPTRLRACANAPSVEGYCLQPFQAGRRPLPTPAAGRARETTTWPTADTPPHAGADPADLDTRSTTSPLPSPEPTRDPSQTV